LRKVKSVAVENDCRRIALFSLLALQNSIFKNQERSIVAFQQLANLGNDGDTFVGIALVVEENSEQLAIGTAFANVERYAALDRGEAARLNDGADDLGVHLGDPVTHHS